MSSYVNNYTDLIKVANDSFNELLEDTTASSFFKNLGSKSYSKYLGRYYYNKSLSNEYENKIIVVPKNGYITQRLVYLNDDLTGGTRVGTQAINVTEQDGSIQLRNSGAVGFCPLGRFFDSLCYAFGIEVDKEKIDIYSLYDSVLQNFEFVYNRETGLHIPINSANFNNVHVLYIVEDDKTYFDEDLVQAFANVMFEDGWFTSENYYDSAITNPPTTITQSELTYYELTPSDIYNNALEMLQYLDEPYRSSAILQYDTIAEAYYTFKEAFPNFIITNASFNYNNVLQGVSVPNFDFEGYEAFRIQQTASYSFNSSIAWENPNCPTVVRLASPNIYGNRVDAIYSISSKRYDFRNVTTVSQSLKSGRIADGARILIGTFNVSVVPHFKQGVTVIDGAKVPTGLDSLYTDYPTWFSRLKNIVGTAVDDVGESLRNVFKIIDFVPLTLIGEKPTEPMSQDTTQTGVVLSPTIIGTLPEYTVKYLTPLPNTDTPINPTTPYYPDSPDYPSDTPIGNPNVDPTTPPVIGGVTPPVPDNPIINSSNGLFTVYNPTQEQLNQFGGYLWGEDIVGILQSIFQNPMQAIISLHVLYATPETGEEIPIRLGYMSSTVNAKEVTKQYINIDCGTVNVPEYYGNVLDYAPYTKAHIYLPFIGIREINVNEIMGGQVNVNYKVDVLTGAVYASISVFHNAISQVLYTFEGNCAVQLPLTGGDVSRLLSGMITGMAVGAKGGMAGAVIGTATGAFASGGLSVSKTNSIGANAGAMGIKKPYIIITHSQAYQANNYNKQYGYPANASVQLSSCKGYTRVKDVHVENISVATQEEKNMIETLLKQGVVIN
ncbi:MAG: glycine zipper family protein [Cellulosilyticum sp.]|nr:glycine zipper family protein [Cellulosilyticum sp.]